MRGEFVSVGQGSSRSSIASSDDVDAVAPVTVDASAVPASPRSVEGRPAFDERRTELIIELATALECASPDIDYVRSVACRSVGTLDDIHESTQPSAVWRILLTTATMKKGIGKVVAHNGSRSARSLRRAE